MATHNPQDEMTGRLHETEISTLASPTVMDGAMQTGTGADDEPEMLVGDRPANDTPLGPDGDGVFSVAEAQELLGGDSEESTTDAGKQMDREGIEKVTT